MDEIIHHLAVIVSRLWQNHIFGEGNTRTTAVFFIKYLRSLGFDATNNIFAENAWYFRNALVIANYNDLKNGVFETTEYLELFLRNLLLGETNSLHEKADIEVQKPDNEAQKPDIQTKLLNVESSINSKTKEHIVRLYSEFGIDRIFGRTEIERFT